MSAPNVSRAIEPEFARLNTFESNDQTNGGYLSRPQQAEHAELMQSRMPESSAKY